MTIEPTTLPTKKDIVRAELAAIWDSRRQLTPEILVEVAEAEDSVLHSLFEWDDAVAGHQYRLVQARFLIRMVKLQVVTSDEILEVRAYHAVHRAGASGAPSGYTPDEVVRQDPEMQAALRRQMQRDLISLRRRYGHLNDFWLLVSEMQDTA